MTDEENHSLIVLGKGISFGKFAGQPILPSEVERVFVRGSISESKSRFIQALEHISPDVLLVTEKIARLAANELRIPAFHDSHYLSLADHLNHALKKTTENLTYPENFQWEVKKNYPEEYKVAVQVVQLIEKELSVHLSENEKTFLTYHFVNAHYDTPENVNHARMTSLITKTIEIVQYHYQTILDQESTNYIRFVTHLRYFILRQLYQEEKNDSVIQEELFLLVQANYRRAYHAAKKIGQMIATHTQQEIGQEELFYLTLHIQRVTDREASLE